MEIRAVRIEVPEGCNIILGQTHFIKTVEDLYEVMVTSVPQAKFGIAFAEASGPCLIRSEGNEDKDCPEVCTIYCATANPLEAIVASTEQGNGIIGVVDGYPPKGVEGDEDKAMRKEFLRKIGHKL